MLLALALACAPSLTCGTGTHEAGGQCVPTGSSEGRDTADTANDSGADTAPDTAPEPAVIEVYLLAGQSNMDGYGYTTGLPPAWRPADPRVPFYWSGWGEFRDLQPASYGGGWVMGPEVSFGRTLADAGRAVALVKHAVGGTDLAFYWNPGSPHGNGSPGEGYRVFEAAVGTAAATLDAAGAPWRWAGFVWMQGESDALDLSLAYAYEANLTGLIAAVRDLTGEPELPAAIGLISTQSNWTYAEIVRDAQTSVAEADPTVVYVETDDLPRNTLDTSHYDGPSERVLGVRFAAALLANEDVRAGTDAPEAAVEIVSGRTDYDFTGTCGFEFTTREPIRVTDIGGQGATYLTSSVEAGIWDDAGNLLVRATVPAWLEAPTSWRGGIWYTAVDPVVLPAGTYRVGLVSWTGDGDRYLNNATGTPADGVTVGGGVYVEGYWLAWPTNVVEGAGISFVGPDFLFVRGG